MKGLSRSHIPMRADLPKRSQGVEGALICQVCSILTITDVRIAYKQRHKYMDYRKNKGGLVFRFCLEHVVQGVNRNKG